MSLRIIMFTAALISAGAMQLVSPATDDAAKPTGAIAAAADTTNYNLLFISLDTTRADHLGCYGYALPTSPHIDELAKQSHLFNACYTLMPTTLPAHLTMFTSLYPAQHGVLRNEHLVGPEMNTLAERLKTAGFHTGGCVGAAVLSSKTGFTQGFDEYVAPRGAEQNAEKVLAQAEDFLQRNRNRRFFLFTHMYDPHIFYQAPEEFRKRFDATEPSLPESRKYLARVEFMPPRYKLTPEVKQQYRRSYDSEIAYADDAIGKLLKRLDQLNLSEKTIVVFTSDHGETLHELYPRFHYGYDHGEFLYRREIQTPLIIRLPRSHKLSKPATHEDQVSHLDLMPTLLELLNVPCAPPFEGRSLVSLLSDKPMPRREIITQRRELSGSLARNPKLKGMEFAVVDNGWHLLTTQSRGDELFHIADDPRQHKNLVSENAAEVHRLKQLLRTWAMRIGPMSGKSRPNTDAEQLEHLRELGYLKDDDETADDDDGNDANAPATAPSPDVQSDR